MRKEKRSSIQKRSIWFCLMVSAAFLILVININREKKSIARQSQLPADTKFYQKPTEIKFDCFQGKLLEKKPPRREIGYYILIKELLKDSVFLDSLKICLKDTPDRIDSLYPWISRKGYPVFFSLVDSSKNDSILMKIYTKLDSEYVVSVFNHPNLEFYRYILWSSTNHGEERMKIPLHNWVDYGKEFMARNRGQFRLLDSLYGTDSTIVTSILKKETYFGHYPGNYGVVSSLYSLYILSSRKREFARRNLAFGIMVAKQKNISPNDLMSLQGSNRAAFGAPQFLFESYVRWGADGDHDGEIDIYNNEKDIIASVAFYLYYHGWRKDMTSAQKAEVIKTYNNSYPYAWDILYFSSLIRNDYKFASKR